MISEQRVAETKRGEGLIRVSILMGQNFYLEWVGLDRVSKKASGIGQSFLRSGMGMISEIPEEQVRSVGLVRISKQMGKNNQNIQGSRW